MLKRIWINDRQQFSVLGYNQQRDLHDFFHPSVDLDDGELLEKRSEITKLDPSLPHRASKAFLALLRPQPQPRAVTGRKKKIVVHGLARSEIDIHMLAQALLDFVFQMSPEERERFAADGKKLRQGLVRSKRAA